MVVAAIMDAAVFMPTQAMISPRLAMVEYAKIFLALLWLTARIHVPTKVNAPKSATMVDMVVSAKAGAMRSKRYVPALTMVAECSRAETGVGATMAPHSQLSKGTCADLVKAARQKKANGSSMAVVFTSMAVILCSTISVDSVPRLF